MTIHIISQNPYRILGVLSNSPLRERVGNQNRLAAFAKVGKETSFPNDFASILTDKPVRTSESIAAANTAINLDKDQLKYAFFWFISGSPMDDIALKHLQAGNREKAEEIFQRKESYSSLINSAVLAFIDGNTDIGFNNISKVVHNSAYRTELFQTLGITNLQLSEEDLAELVIAELLKEISASKILSVCTDPTDRAIVSKSALEKTISAINSAIAVAKSADTKNPEASLAAGTKLMNSTKAPLKTVKDIAGASNPQYQMVADNIAKQVLQCGINFVCKTQDSDVNNLNSAFELLSYSLSIAIGKLVKDRCLENYKNLKERINSLPPNEVTSEYEKILTALKDLEDYEDVLSKFSNDSPRNLLLNNAVTAINAVTAVYIKASPHEINKTIRKCAIRMGIIRRQIGEKHPFYIYLGNIITQRLLLRLIEYVNFQSSRLNASNQSQIARYLNIDKFKRDMSASYSTILDIGIFPCDMQTSEWYEDNKKNLETMLRDIIDLRESSSSSIYSEEDLYKQCEIISDYNEYLIYYPNGRYSNEARIMISNYEKIQSFQSLAECISYIGEFESQYLEKALDSKAFDFCKTFFDYKKYCSKFSYHKDDAQKIMNTILKKRLTKIIGIIITIGAVLSIIIFWRFLTRWAIALIIIGVLIYWGSVIDTE